MNTGESFDKVQDRDLAELKEKLGDLSDLVIAQGETIQQLKTKIAVWSAFAALGGAIIAGLFSEWLLPLILQ